MAIDSTSLPPQPPAPPVITDELQAQLAELTRRAMAQLQELLDSMRQAEAQLPKTPEEPPVTGGPDPLPLDDDTVVGIGWPGGPPELAGFWDETEDAAPTDVEAAERSHAFSAASRLEVVPLEQVAAALSAVPDDLVAVAAPAAVVEPITAPSVPAAVAAVAEAPQSQAFASHEFRVGAEGHAA